MFFHNGFIFQEYGGWDLSRIVKNASKITGWGLKHVKYVTYQLLCGLLYMQVRIDFNKLKAEWTYCTS